MDNFPVPRLWTENSSHICGEGPLSWLYSNSAGVTEETPEAPRLVVRPRRRLPAPFWTSPDPWSERRQGALRTRWGRGPRAEVDAVNAEGRPP